MAKEEENNEEISETQESLLASDKKFSPTGKPGDSVYLSGMYKNWFLDYASYVILERAVPHVYDGLKPVQRRILHSMKQLDDGRYNKVANIIGHTMQYHPHGDASIGEALVQLGQKNLLIDCQGNWGNIYTGDSAAAPRYIEARLSKFALEVVFNPKTTFWKPSYDGRNKEPITLPVKFPLLLAQGVEGIAVGLASKILPHNFNELIDACIDSLQDKKVEFFPDFPTGGFADFSRYNDGLRGGAVKIRAKISRLDKKTLVITELPFGETTDSLIESIIKANDQGKIKIKKIDDNTAAHVEILVHLIPGASPDITIDALFAFTKCQVSISPNACIIEEDKPRFIGVSEILQISVQNTLCLLRRELEIEREELLAEWHSASLEKYFIENKIYLKIEGSKTEDDMVAVIDKGLAAFKKKLKREVTREDIIRLSEIPFKRTTKYNAFKADEHIKSIEGKIEMIDHHLEHIIQYAIDWYKKIRKKYGTGRERKTEIRNFDDIQATRVVAANEKLYVNRKEGFIGTGLKKDEFICDCSDIDHIIVFRRDGKYLITKVADKTFVGKDIIHIAVFNKNDERTIYNVVYRDGKYGNAMIKRCAIVGMILDKEYDIGKGTESSKILYFSANPNGEAEIIKVLLKPKPKMKKIVFEQDFSQIDIKGRSAHGNILTKHDVHKIVLKEQGTSTLGGLKIWFDRDVLRLNTEERGDYLGEFMSDDKILTITSSGCYILTNYDLTNHFEEDLLIIEKFDPQKIWSVVHFDGEQCETYLKRFQIEESDKLNSFISEHPESKMILINDDKWPQLEISFGGKHKKRDGEIVDVAEFIGVKSYKARGKRISPYEISEVSFIEPLSKEEESQSDNADSEDDLGFTNRINKKAPKDPKQMSLF
ncbi:MAG: DNA gyrase/topoisomerase IV subunit A [Bacteroidia bacterium]|nr:DNA gyrase/topoisomerase IV subunit A [Bacteroidia bacterium]